MPSVDVEGRIQEPIDPEPAFAVKGSGCKVQGLGFKVEGLGFQGSGFMVV